MSNLSEFIGGDSTPAVIPGITIQTGESLTIGDQVLLDYQGKAIKASASTILTALTSVPTLNLKGSVEYALNLFVITTTNTTNSSTFTFYNRATNTIIAQPTIAFAITNIIDIRTLPNGEVVILFNTSSNVQFVKYTSAGVLVFAPVTVGTLATFFSNGNYNLILPSSVTGEFMIGAYLVTSVYFSAYHYNSAGAFQGTTTATTIGNSSGASGRPTQTMTGGGFILVTMCLDSNTGHYYLINATTRAVVSNGVASGYTAQFNQALTWDATNSQFVWWYRSNSNASITVAKVTTAGVFTVLIDLNVASTADTAFMFSPTAMFLTGAGSTFIEYTTANTGTASIRKTSSTSGKLISQSSNINPITLPNLCFQSSIPLSGGGLSTSYFTYTDASGLHAYTLNQTTGVLTGIFSYLANPALSSKVAARLGQRYEISVTLDFINLTVGQQLNIRRADAGVLYGRAKVVKTTTVDVDTSVLGGVTDSALVTSRSRFDALANNVSYFIGG